MSKPIILYGHAQVSSLFVGPPVSFIDSLPQGPNPWKVAIILEELGLKYEHKMLDFPDMKKEPYESINPNGRVPSIEDPNTGLAIFEVSPQSHAFLTLLLRLPLPPSSSCVISYTSEPSPPINFPQPVWRHHRIPRRYLRQIQLLALRHPQGEIRHPQLALLPSLRSRPLLWPKGLVHLLPPRKGHHLRHRPLQQRNQARTQRYRPPLEEAQHNIPGWREVHLCRLGVCAVGYEHGGHVEGFGGQRAGSSKGVPAFPCMERKAYEPPSGQEVCRGQEEGYSYCIWPLGFQRRGTFVRWATNSVPRLTRSW